MIRIKVAIALILFLFSFIFPLPQSSFSEVAQETWSGIYIKGRKSGHTVISIKKVDNGYVISEDVEMIFKAMNTLRE